MLIKKIILKSVVQTIGKKTTCPAQDLEFIIAGAYPKSHIE